MLKKITQATVYPEWVMGMGRGGRRELSGGTMTEVARNTPSIATLDLNTLSASANSEPHNLNANVEVSYSSTSV